MNNSFCIAASMQKKVGGILSCLFVLFLLASCQSYKKVPYLQDSEVVGQVAQQETLYDARIMPKDQLTIMVSCTNPELAAPFNLGVVGSVGLTSGNSQGTSQSSQQTYLVDNEGNINFPVLGTFTISNEKVNLLEALAMAGDMTIYGIRDNVKLIREGADGKQQIITLDLNKAETLLSPYYWLQQNDIVYVTPNKAKARNSDISSSTSIWFSATSILISLASLLVTIFR